MSYYVELGTTAASVCTRYYNSIIYYSYNCRSNSNSSIIVSHTGIYYNSSNNSKSPRLEYNLCSSDQLLDDLLELLPVLLGPVVPAPVQAVDGPAQDGGHSVLQGRVSERGPKIGNQLNPDP